MVLEEVLVVLKWAQWIIVEVLWVCVDSLEVLGGLLVIPDEEFSR